MITLSCWDLKSIDLRPYLTCWGRSDGFLESPVNPWGLLFSWFLVAPSICGSGFSVPLGVSPPTIAVFSSCFMLSHQWKSALFWFSLRPFCTRRLYAYQTWVWVRGGSSTLWNTKPLRIRSRSAFVPQSPLFLPSQVRLFQRLQLSAMLLIPQVCYISFLPCFLILNVLWKLSFLHVLMQSNCAPIPCGPGSPFGYPEPH